MKLRIPDEDVMISLGMNDGGDMEVLANGLVLLWINKNGSVTRCCESRLGTILGFQMDDEGAVVME